MKKEIERQDGQKAAGPETEPQQAAAEEAQENAQEPQPNAESESDAELKAMEAERDKYLDMAARLQAEFNNFRNRNQNTRAEAYDDGNSDCVKDILPVLDNFERAIAAAEQNGESESMVSGFKMIDRQLRDALVKRGLEELKPVGEKFDPNVHNAVFRVSADEAEGEPGTIVEVLQTGYAVKGRIIRHPMVKVIED